MHIKLVANRAVGLKRDTDRAQVQCFSLVCCQPPVTQRCKLPEAAGLQASSPTPLVTKAHKHNVATVNSGVALRSGSFTVAPILICALPDTA